MQNLIHRRMMSAKRLRKCICNVITESVSGVVKKDAEENDLSKANEHLFHSFAACDDGGDEICNHDEHDDNNVTPLMVACDKSCSGALIYLQNQLDRASLSSAECQQYPSAIQVEQLVEAWGHPTEASSCGNTAAHHALSAGFSEGIYLLAGLWGTIEKIQSHDMNCKDSDVVQERYIPLLKQTNENGDTPIMMACVSGQVIALKSILETMCKLSLKPPSDNVNASESIEKTWQLFKDIIFCVKNSEECTALNLACGYGQEDIVKFLIRPQNVGLNTSTREVKLLSNNEVENDATVCIMQKPLVDVSYNDVEFCQKTVENVACGLKFMKEQNQVDRIEEFEIQLKKAKECKSLLTRELERISAETANELLDSGGTVVPSLSKGKPNTSKSKSKVKKKKKQQRKNTKQHQSHDTEDSELKAERVGAEETKNNERAHTIWANVKNERGIESESQSSNTEPPFITLQDGTVISRAAKADYIPSEEPAMNLPFEDSKSNKTISGAKPKALESILQSSSVTSDDCDVAAIMESLCLDASMLFLSAHGMAIDMSPCQLEAVESILTHQLNAAKEAQNIQRRLLDK